MADSSDLKFLVEGLSQKGRRRVFLIMLVKIGINQRDKHEEGKISFSEISPMDKASELAGVSQKQYRNYLNEEVRIPLGPTTDALASFDKIDQKLLILFDWKDSVIEFKNTFPGTTYDPLRSREEPGVWEESVHTGKLKERDDRFVIDEDEIKFKWVQNNEFTTDKSAVKDCLGKDYEEGWEGYKRNLEYVKASLPRLNNNQAVMKEITRQIMHDDLRKKTTRPDSDRYYPFYPDGMSHTVVDRLSQPSAESYKLENIKIVESLDQIDAEISNYPFHIDEKRHTIVAWLAETLAENYQMSEEETIEFIDTCDQLDPNVFDFDRLKEICEKKLFSEVLKDEVKSQLDQIEEKLNRD